MIKDRFGDDCYNFGYLLLKPDQCSIATEFWRPRRQSKQLPQDRAVSMCLIAPCELIVSASVPTIIPTF